MTIPMMPLITCDFETFYAKEYSLSKITTEEYIRDDRFEVIGVAVKVGNGETQWFSGTHAETAAFLAQFDWAHSMVLAHNCAFDAAILNWRFGIRPRALADTMSMGNAVGDGAGSVSLAALATKYDLGEKGTAVKNFIGYRRADFTPEELAEYAEYCINDVNLCYLLFQLMLAKGFPTPELKLIDMTLRMFTEPVFELDTSLLERHLEDVVAKKEKLLAECSIDQDTLMSNKKLAEKLIELGVTPPMKISKATGKETYAFAKTDEGFRNLPETLPEDSPLRLVVDAIVAARIGTKSTLEETRTQRFIGISKRGKLPVPIKYCGAKTKRWSGEGGGINMQNLPKSSPLKEAIRAPAGQVIVGADLSNIELRVGLWFGGVHSGLDALRAGRDLYREFGSMAFGVDYAAITADQRFIAKTCCLALIYGTGAKKLRESIKTGSVMWLKKEIDIGLEEATRIVELYRTTYAGVVDAWAGGKRVLEAIYMDQYMEYGPDGVLKVHGRDGILLPSGLYMSFPGLTKTTTDKGGIGWAYKTRKGLEYTHGAKTFQGCLAAGTEVLSNRGWVPIERVGKNDLIHDGVEFVNHGGLVFQGFQTCVSIDGVSMTQDHEVLTNEGWKPASENPEPFRPDLRGADSVVPSPQRWKETVLGISVRVRELMSKARDFSNARNKTRRNPELRMHDPNLNRSGQHQARVEPSFNICCVGFHDSSLHKTEEQGVGALRWARHQSVRALASVVRKFLCGYGAHVPVWAAVRPEGQQWGLHPQELPLGNGKAEQHEQAQHQAQGGRQRAEQENRNIGVNSLLPLISRVASGKTNNYTSTHQPVYDIMNCGPRTRFVVRGVSGPYIVHNCIQALARCQMGDGMLRTRRRYPVALTIHDAEYFLAPEAEGQAALDFAIEQLCVPPVWASDLPLAAEGGFGHTLKDC